MAGTPLRYHENHYEYQYDYFLDGDETMLRPMILKDIAEKVSLISRPFPGSLTASMFKPSFGTFLLKSFFSEAIQNDQGRSFPPRDRQILSGLN
ncbi:MAG: hypothetical protein IPH88_15690 [Bacteroidales bacterium]|nr:hypothetical protein [Bacteroidales bacterium]